MITAKKLLHGRPEYKAYPSLLSNEAFEPACHAALMELVESLPPGAADPSKAWDSYLQIVGARKVLDLLGRLHEPDATPKPEQWPTLNYEQKGQ